MRYYSIDMEYGEDAIFFKTRKAIPYHKYILENLDFYCLSFAFNLSHPFETS